ncbi:isopentenyl-diphosphate Delta-isomerase [Amnibacterium kyonggiense]|uniref:Isopentenyl-diphosphate Delta-isomerase n=1 Tax=Amnibacterium kyonggiense TaxID=595671 RepID=A0A4R7FQD1_9MICO|nr:isopentenyl-diphosphate Delta-isomerase [Amnibacterium kyonggiense]TDS79878.1 isopentenyl-diphosphate delta-isomerase [Amnibacterium kyonggiense]
MTEKREQVVLLDEDGTPIGTADKATVHGPDTPLHLAFSCHVRDAAGRLLVTRRALAKRTWPGVWTNSFCGHPAPGEDLAEAVARRASDELGITVSDLRLALPDFRYRAVDAAGVVENEICPVYTAVTLDEVQVDPDEVAEHRWIDADDLEVAVSRAPWAFSPWLGLQLVELAAVRG